MPAPIQIFRLGFHLSRNLSENILIAFEHACDSRDLVTARELLGSLEVLFERQSSPLKREHLKNIENLVLAHRRLFECRIETAVVTSSKKLTLALDQPSDTYFPAAIPMVAAAALGRVLHCRLLEITAPTQCNSMVIDTEGA